MNISVVIITGSMGAGKTTILGEVSDLLSAAGIVHAAIDLDALGIGLLPDGGPTDLVYRNLHAVWNNYSSAGVGRLVLASALEEAHDVERIRASVSPVSNLVICRLKADVSTMQRRVAEREPGMLQARFVARTAELEAVLDRANVEDFSVVNENRSPTDVARELLERAGWPGG